MAGPHTARGRARAQMLTDIKQQALRQLGEEGAAALSLRAIARDLGVVSSGLYRYYANRDALLTALIIDAYDDLTAAVDTADADLAPSAFRDRWIARCAALRRWALAEPARFQLLYGTPVPGYRAPEDTVGPAVAVDAALVRLVADAAAAGALRPLPAVGSEVLEAQLERVAVGLGLAVPPAALAVAVSAVGTLVGLVTLELGGHFVGGFEPVDALFAHAVGDLADRLGLPSGPA
jgi:AcrR family transcriptional regulator